MEIAKLRPNMMERPVSLRQIQERLLAGKKW
jgi:hypothetical protein